jgi:hypothetical protein
MLVKALVEEVKFQPGMWGQWKKKTLAEEALTCCV